MRYRPYIDRLYLDKGFDISKSGWWGFAALNEADFKIKTPAGEEKRVEIGAVLWVHFENWQEK